MASPTARPCSPATSFPPASGRPSLVRSGRGTRWLFWAPALPHHGQPAVQLFHRPAQGVVIPPVQPAGEGSLGLPLHIPEGQVPGAAQIQHPLRKGGLHPDPDLALEPGEEALERVRALTGGRGADVVIEAAGGPDTFQTAWQAARPSGIVVVAAMYEESQSLPLPEMYGKNLTFKTGGVDASRGPELVSLLAQGKLRTDFLITHRGPLSEILEGYRVFESHEGHCLKWVVTPG